MSILTWNTKQTAFDSIDLSKPCNTSAMHVIYT